MALSSSYNSDSEHQAPTEEPELTAWNFTCGTNVHCFFQLTKDKDKDGDQDQDQDPSTGTSTQDKRYGLMCTGDNPRTGPPARAFKDRGNHFVPYTEASILNHSSSTKQSFRMYNLGPGQKVTWRDFAGGKEIAPSQEQT